MRVFVTAKLGPKRSLTPEGYLFCEDVPIARVGEMLYGPGEVPIDPGPDGIIRVSRTEQEVFSPETIASFEGKPVTMGHPDDDVGPENWQELSVGVVQNVRRGDGGESDLLLADLLITVKEAIQAVTKQGLREISCGYDAEYVQIEPGRGEQREIRGNHSALIDQGRCGPRCAIGDQKTMGKKGKRSAWDRIWTAFKANDEAAMQEAVQEARDEAESEVEPKNITINMPAAEAKKEEAAAKDDGEDVVKALAERVSALEAAVEKLSKPTTDEETAEDPDKTADDGGDLTEAEQAQVDPEAIGNTDPASTGDSASFAVAFQDVVSRAEILSPGIKIPTIDAKMGRIKARDNLCAFKRQALKRAMTGDSAEAVQAMLGGKTVEKLTCDGVGHVFTGASEIARRQNSGAQIIRHGNANDNGVGAKSIADINAANRAFWNKK